MIRFLLFYTLLIPLTYAQQRLTWSDAFLYINFGNEQKYPYTNFNISAFSPTPTIFSDAKSAHLGVYGSQAWTISAFTYMLDLTPYHHVKRIDIALSFAEIYEPSCRLSGRMLNIFVDDNQLYNLSIFQRVGCRKEFDLPFYNINALKLINITIQGLVQNPYIAALFVRPNVTEPIEKSVSNMSTLSPLSTPSQNTVAVYPNITSIQFIDAGGGSGSIDHDVPNTTVFKDFSVLVLSTTRPSVFATQRVGHQFSYIFQTKAAFFDVQLGFAEIDTQFCDDIVQNVTNPRIFSVELNGAVVPELNAINVARKVGCRTAFIWNIRNVVTLKNDKYNELLIKFIGLGNNAAFVNYIMVRPVMGICIPESTAKNGQTADHLAHAVPGEYQARYIDFDKDGTHTVLVDGGGSHSHFFDAEKKVIGRVTQYNWTDADTGEFLSDLEKFSFAFRLGTTRLLLTVTDNICSTDESETSITVTKSKVPGSFCYFYSGVFLSNAATVGGESGLAKGDWTSLFTQKHDYVKSYTETSWDFSTDVPPASAGEPFAARCFFYVTISEDEASLQGKIQGISGGSVQLHRGSERVLLSKNGAFSIPVVATVTALQVSYVRTNGSVNSNTRLTITSSNPSIFHDRSVIVPAIYRLHPTAVDVVGVPSAYVYVIGPFRTAKSVHIGNVTVEVSISDPIDRRIYFPVPAREEGAVAISVLWKTGELSNELELKYASAADDRIQFQQINMTEQNGTVAVISLVSTIRIASDGNLYLGTLDAQVIKIEYDMDSLKVIHRCTSIPLKDPRFIKKGMLAKRVILGMAFNPRIEIPMPYVTTQSLYWRIYGNIDRNNTAAWRNGAIERLKPVEEQENICLAFDKRIVVNLPVSNHDHGVNGLEFDQNGNLLVSVGGNTNAGLPSKGLGQVWEFPLSGSILRFPLRKLNFDGNLQYNNDETPELAQLVKGDVEVLATGIRNAFYLCLHSSGRLYTADNGPNAGFGNIAVSCDEKDRMLTYPTDPATDWPGTVQVKTGWKKYSVSRRDKLLLLRDGAFYGHPHLHRGECAWIDPETHMDVSGNSPPSNYERPLALLRSSVNAVVEYTAGGVFGGRLRGQLFLSSLKDRGSYFVPPHTSPDSGVGEQIEKLTESGGLSAAVNARGDIILARLAGDQIRVLRPIVPKLEQLTQPVVVNVTPLRHGRKGGAVLRVGGINFGKSKPDVSVGGRMCQVFSNSERIIKCKMPSARVGESKATVMVSRSDGMTASLKDAVWYMNI